MAKNHGLFRPLKTVKTVIDCQDNCKLSRQLQNVKTVVDSCHQLVRLWSIYKIFKSLPRQCRKFYKVLEGTARYAGLLLAPAEGFGLRPRLFLPFCQF